MQHFSYTSLFNFTLHVFTKIGCNTADAQLAAKVLLTADLRGIDSHGIARLIGYVRLKDAGRVNPNPDIKVEHETPSTAVLNGNQGLGLVVAPKAMEIAMEKAKNVGTGWVCVNNSNHFGIAGYHAMMALEEDMIGIALTNASPFVAPTFSKSRMLGTNPIAIAIPAGNEPPFVADLATTTVANGKLEILERKKESALNGWVQDISGKASIDPTILKKGGALLPLGSDREHSSHKGYALGAAVDILSAVLSGASYGPWVPPFPAFASMPDNMPGKGLGHFIGAMRIDAFRAAEDFKKHMDNWIQAFRNADRVKEQQPVLIPGDPERAAHQQRLKTGIPLLQPVIDDLDQLSNQLGIPNIHTHALQHPL